MPTILVVDDAVDDLRAMKRGAEEAIAAMGGRVETASDPDTAIQLLKEKAFDVVITDLHLTEPDKNYEGWDVLQYAKRLNPSTKVVVVTRYPEPDIDVKSLSIGAYRYMDKLKKDLIDQTKEIVIDALNAG